MTGWQPGDPLYYKAVRPDGRDFRTGTMDYAAALGNGHIVTHPTCTTMVPNKPATYLSVSTVPAESLVGGSW
ncbi:MAG: hypothetical protein ACRD0W_09605, partial [Acidimicrobiales bacterium]